ncbi:MAG TPA: hypothetical protein VK509_23890 [Polyangiales bacterium]|nr:hypothetical protein [Polyangiales bacterium]
MQWKARLIGSCTALCLCSCLFAACGDDDEDATGRDGGAKSNVDRDGGRKPPIVVTPRQAVAGACLIQTVAGKDHFDDCTGFAQLEACTRQQCELETCVDQCTQYMTCLYESATPCDSACLPETGCLNCMQTVGRCVFEGTCVDTFACVEHVDGGRCDALQSCCGEQQGELRDQCMLVAKATAATQGEKGCAQFLEAVPSLADAAVCPD